MHNFRLHPILLSTGGGGGNSVDEDEIEVVELEIEVVEDEGSGVGGFIGFKKFTGDSALTDITKVRFISHFL